LKIDAAATNILDSGLPSKKPADAAQTASDFEALLIGQMLKSARADSQGWFGTGEDTSAASLIEMAEDQMAKVLAQGGGMGLGKMIRDSLQPPKIKSEPQEGSSTVQMSGKLR
jgi:Rod binding domain-containing protein